MSTKRPVQTAYRSNEALVRQLVSQGHYEHAPEYDPVKQGRFFPGSDAFSARVQVICKRNPPPPRRPPYSLHTAVIIEREAGPIVRLIEGTYDLTLDEAERLMWG